MIISAVIDGGLIYNPLKQVPTWPSMVGFAEMFVFYNSWVKFMCENNSLGLFYDDVGTRYVDFSE